MKIQANSQVELAANLDYEENRHMILGLEPISFGASLLKMLGAVTICDWL